MVRRVSFVKIINHKLGFNNMNMRHFLFSLVFSGFLLGQTYTVGSYVNDFSGQVCHNGDGTWSYNVDGAEKVVWINLFTSW